MIKRLTIGLSALVFWACSSETENILPRNNFKVQGYYVTTSDVIPNDNHAFMAARALLEIQRWYQTATGGLTFELLDEENIVVPYMADQASSFYEEDWWSLLLNEMKNKDLPVESPGTIVLVWIEGVDQLSPEAFALGATICDGDCGAALMPVTAVVDESGGVQADLGSAIHEIGHTLGLHHPVELKDLPVSAEDSTLLYSVMTQANIRLSTNNLEYGFLTNEKETLKNNPFLKPSVDIYQTYWNTRIINYPVTGSLPVVDFQSEKLSSTELKFSAQTEAGLYYWYFGDGTTSNEQSPIHSFGSGIYNVTLMVTSPNNMSARISRFVEVP